MRVDRIDFRIESLSVLVFKTDLSSFPPLQFSLHGWETLFQMDYLHDDVFLLLRPEFISLFLSYLSLVVSVRFK